MAPNTSLAAEILELLATHAGQPVDFVALFMFLNTVAGGHYEERVTEDELATCLRALLAANEIEAWKEDHPLRPEVVALSSQSRVQFRRA